MGSQCPCTEVMGISWAEWSSTDRSQCGQLHCAACSAFWISKLNKLMLKLDDHLITRWAQKMNAVSFAKGNTLLGHEPRLLWLKDDITYYCTFCVFTTREQMSIWANTNTAEKCRLSFQMLRVYSLGNHHKQGKSSAFFTLQGFPEAWHCFSCMEAFIIGKDWYRYGESF